MDSKPSIGVLVFEIMLNGDGIGIGGSPKLIECFFGHFMKVEFRLVQAGFKWKSSLFYGDFNEAKALFPQEIIGFLMRYIPMGDLTNQRVPV